MIQFFDMTTPLFSRMLAARFSRGARLRNDQTCRFVRLIVPKRR